MKNASSDRHALMQVSFRYRLRWSEVEEFWWNPPHPAFKTPEMRRSLLHAGFGADATDDNDEIDRVIFYLELADRHDHQTAVVSQGSREPYFLTASGYQPASDIRKDLCREAFKRLCEGYFKKADSSHYCSLSVSERLFPKLMWFFRRTHNNGCRSGNIFPVNPGMPEHYLETARSFAKNFAQLAWDFNQATKFWADPNLNRLETYNRLRRSVVDVVGLMIDLGIENMIADDQWLADEKTFQVLSQHVLEKVGHFPIKGRSNGWEKRNPRDIGEAATWGDQLARTLLLVSAKHAARRNLGLIAKPV